MEVKLKEYLDDIKKIKPTAKATVYTKASNG
jgi:hypothetical protein